MPRKAPSNVEEVRITLGDFERRQLVEAVDAYNRDKWLENVPYMIIAGAGSVAAVGLFLAGYGLYNWFNLPSIKDVIADAFDNGKTFFTPYIDPVLGETKTGEYTQYNAYMKYIDGATWVIISRGEWPAQKPLTINTATLELQAELNTLQSVLERATMMAESESPMMAPLGTKLKAKAEKAIADHEIKSGYILYALENVIFSPGKGQALAEAHIPPNQWFPQGTNWPPPQSTL